MRIRNMNENKTATRLRQVCNNCYGGNASDMGHDLGWGYSTLTRYLSGKATPPARLLITLSRSKGISLKWLKGEGGEQIEFEKDEEVEENTGIAYSLPVVAVPYESVPKNDDLGATRMIRETTRYHSRADRYWIRTDRAYQNGTIQPGDYLLIRAFPKSQAKDCDVGKLSVFRRGEELILEEVRRDDIANGVGLVGKVRMVERDLD
jgi:transcriptional regulator with XRE-family HTH domain